MAFRRPGAGLGDMCERITLQGRRETADGAGGVALAWADFAVSPVVWAAVRARAGREGLDAGRTNATMVTEFTIYTRDDVSERDRIVWNGEAYNIRGVRRGGGRALRMVIEAERGAAS